MRAPPLATVVDAVQGQGVIDVVRAGEFAVVEEPHCDDDHGWELTVGEADEEIFVVALCNLTSSNPKEVTDTLAAIVFGEEYTVPEVREAIELNPELYRTYEGEYQLALGINITITAGEHFIIATGTGGGTANFFPESETQFFRKSTDDKITFVKFQKENVRYLLVTQQGMEVRANIVE